MCQEAFLVRVPQLGHHLRGQGHISITSAYGGSGPRRGLGSGPAGVCCTCPPPLSLLPSLAQQGRTQAPHVPALERSGNTKRVVATSFLFHVERQRKRTRHTHIEQPVDRLFIMGALRVSSVEGPPGVLVCPSQSTHTTFKHPPSEVLMIPTLQMRKLKLRGVRNLPKAIQAGSSRACVGNQFTVLQNCHIWVQAPSTLPGSSPVPCFSVG